MRRVRRREGTYVRITLLPLSIVVGSLVVLVLLRELAVMLRQSRTYTTQISIIYQEEREREGGD
jgi:hypothetical protein